MRRSAVLLVAAVVGAWLAAWLLWTALLLPRRHGAGAGDGGERRVFVAEGYLGAVDLFLRHDWLVYDPAREEISLALGLAGTPAGDFYDSSFLAADVAAFNGGERSVFRVDNGQILAIDPNRHNISLPFTAVPAWLGRLTYRPEPGRRAELVGAGVRVHLEAPRRPLAEHRGAPEAVLRVGRRDRPASIWGEVVDLVGEGNVFFGKLHLAGDGVVFNRRQDLSGVDASISGERVLVGNRARLGSGDVLKLRWRLAGRSRYALLGTSVLDAAPAISAYRSVNGRWRRTPAEPEPRFAAEVVTALDGAFQRRPRGGEARVPGSDSFRRFDVALTLDARLQEAVEERLQTYARTLRRPDEPPFRAAVTVMDATDGELLALASYPTDDDLEGWSGASAARTRLLRNHNFSRLPIGSVAKVMLAAAILDDAPFLAALEIPGYAGGEIEDVLGLALDPVLRDHSVWGGADGRVDFDEFIEQSSNKYAATLVTLAAAVDDGGTALRRPAAAPEVPDRLAPASRFRLAGGEWERRPELRFPVVAHRDEEGRESEELAAVGRITTAELLGHAERLRDVFDVPISRKTPLTADRERRARYGHGAGDDLVDTSPWLPLLAHLYGDRASIPLGHTFYGVSPERPNLAYNLVDDYRREYLSVVLGGGSSTWTNPAVCRFFSQLVTGRDVRPTLVSRVSAAGGASVEPAGEAPPLGMDEPSRRRLADALTRVAGGNGTARALRPSLEGLDGRLERLGETLGYFSKTGSPDNVAFVPTRTARALDELIRRGALRLDAAGRVVDRDGRPFDAEGRDGDGDDRSLVALTANADDMAVLARHRVGARTVVRVADTWNDARPEDRVQFEVEAGRLVRALSVARVDSVGGAYAFVLAAYPRTARRPPPGAGYLPLVDVGEPPLRALAVSIVIESQGDGPTIAVPFARTLIEEVLDDVLVAGW